MPAILFGSISTLADTSEQQRAAFNTAFEAHGLDWVWGREEYQSLLSDNGGEQRIADYAAERGVDVDAAAVHRTKSENFQQSLRSTAIRPRPGVQETIRTARENGWQLALVTTTSAANLDALFDGLDGYVARDDFDLVVDRSAVDDPKPAPEVWQFALAKLGAQPAGCVAIEDNVGGLRSAQAAGVTCVVFSNENTSGQDFGDAPRSVHLHLDELAALVPAA